VDRSGEQPLNLLVVHGDVPPPDRDACSLRLFRILELLAAEGHLITFIGRGGAAQERNTALLLRMGVQEVFPIDPERLAQHLGRGDLGRPIPVVDFEGSLTKGCFDVALLSGYDVAEQYLGLIRRYSPATRIVIDASDVQWVREHRGATISGDPAALAGAERTRERERAVYGAADGLVAISEVDAAAMRELAPEVPVGVVSLVQSFSGAVAEPAGREEVLFVGNFHHAPNVDAVGHFCESIWPLVRQALPEAHLTLVGTAPPPAVQAHDGDDVTVTGWVPSVEPYLERARVSIAPLRYGAGVKGKIAEAIAAGVPVVTTSIGAEGMGFVDGEHALIADEPAEFAAAIVRLYRDEDLWRTLVVRAPEHLAAIMGPEAGRAALAEILRRAAPARWQAPGDAPWLDELLASYARAFAAGDAATLVLTASAEDHQAPQAIFDRVVEVVAELGLDLDAMADIEITAWDERLPVPRRTIVHDGPPATVPAAVPVARRRRTRRVAVVVQASYDAPTLAAQLTSLRRAVSSEDVDVVIVASGQDPAAAALLGDGHGARVIRCDDLPGRASTQTLAVEATSAPILIALGPLALPRAGLVGPLVEAVSSGASFAGATVGGAHGFRVAEDGSLWPRDREQDGSVQALAFDCLAARRETWMSAPLTFSQSEGHPERQLAQWAVSQGPLATCDASIVDRVDVSPVSVIICTRNRAEELPDGVALLVASGVTRGGGEVIIVDNASTDDTADVAARLVASHPGVRVVLEEQAGVSRARNAGAAAARNELLCWIDDDARPAPGWRESLAWALTRPGVAAAGGPICALWPPGRVPGWPPTEVSGALSVLDCGDAVRVLVPPEIAYAASWGTRREALLAAGRFDAPVGYSPDRRISGEEVAVAWQLHLRGLGATLYTPGAAVGHRIPASRMCDSYLVERWFTFGVEDAHLRIERMGKGRDRFLADAREGAARLMRALPLSGELTLEEALAQVQRRAIPVTARTVAASALGLLAASTLLLGEDEVIVGELRLHLRPQHLRAVLSPLTSRTG
jgi:glycosyltransferase involved in cell wall biosynthesis